MNSFENILEEFPPRYASEVVCLSDIWSWYFILSDGKIIGGGEGITHRKILGIKDEERDHRQLEMDFCIKHKALRIAISSGRLYIEIFHVAPSEAQWAAIGTLYQNTEKAPMVWDVWLKNDKSNHPWKNSEGTLAKFKRSIEASGIEVER
jgi:hypothetical protein